MFPSPSQSPESSSVASVYPSGTPRFAPMSPLFEDRIHPASLEPCGEHDPRLLEFIRSDVSHELVTFLSRHTTSIIASSTEIDTKMLKSKTDAFPSLTTFIAVVCEQSNVQVSTLLATIVYLERLRPRLPRVAKGLPCTRHRVFLATLICAAKYLNDSSPKNKHWCRYAQMFSQEEINLMEKQLLYLLDYNLAITEDEVIDCAEFFLERYSFDVPATPESIPSSSLPVTPRLPSGSVLPDVSEPAPPVPAKPSRRPAHPYDMDVHAHVAPGLDRSDSSSSIGSVGPLTPRSQDNTPSPEVRVQRPARAALAPAKVHIADPDMPPFLATAGAAAKDARDSIVKRLFGRRREECA